MTPTLRTAAALAAAVAALLALQRTDRACIHPPAEYKGSLEEGSRQAIIFHDKGREELILKVDFKLAGGDAQSLGDIAWVIPTPTVPDHYSVEDDKAFEELFRLTADRPNNARSKSLEDKGEWRAAGGIELLKRVQVGDYAIQPIKARGKEAAAKLNEWLTENRFSALPEKTVEFYVAKGWTFLAVKVAHKAGGEGGPASGGALKPLRISFASEEIVYPMKISAGGGRFDATLYVITPDELPAEAVRDRAQKYGLYPEPVNSEIAADGPGHPALTKLWKAINAEGRLTFAKGRLTKLGGRDINSPASPLASWETDFSLPHPSGK
jgi:hypothetical protein